jgi:predicted nucleic acid-binding protein
MIRAVLDTNVLASGALGLTGGVTPPALLLHQWRAGRFGLIISNYIEEELRKTLAQPYFKGRIRSEPFPVAARAGR